MLKLLCKRLVRTNSWVKENSFLFTKHKKMYIEFQQMQLFNSSFKPPQPLKNLIDYYLDNEIFPKGKHWEDVVLYRKIEYFAIKVMQGHTKELDKIENAFKKSLLIKLLTKNIFLDVLGHRDILYAITHEIFYVSVFGQYKDILHKYVLEHREKLIELIEMGLLITMQNKDIDVLLELICCVHILNIDNDLDSYVLSLSYHVIINSQATDGAIIPTMKINYYEKNIHDDKLFKKVYHSTFVANILFYLLQDSNYNRRDYECSNYPNYDTMFLILRHFNNQAPQEMFQGVNAKNKKSLSQLDYFRTYPKLLESIILNLFHKEEWSSSGYCISLYKRIGDKRIFDMFKQEYMDNIPDSLTILDGYSVKELLQ